MERNLNDTLAYTGVHAHTIAKSLRPGGGMAVGMAADGAVLNLSTPVHSHRGDSRLPGLLAAEIRRPPLS